MTTPNRSWEKPSVLLKVASGMAKQSDLCMPVFSALVGAWIARGEGVLTHKLGGVVPAARL